MSPVDTVLSRLPDAKQSTPGRWRTACPVCGGKNKSTLSVGEGDGGAVLLKCFKSGCDADRIARALGLDITDLFPARPDSAPLKRRRMLPATQALDLLDQEAGIVAVLAADIGHGRQTSPTDRARAIKAAARITMLRDEAQR